MVYYCIIIHFLHYVSVYLYSNTCISAYLYIHEQSPGCILLYTLVSKMIKLFCFAGVGVGIDEEGGRVNLYNVKN